MPAFFTSGPTGVWPPEEARPGAARKEASPGPPADSLQLAEGQGLSATEPSRRTKSGTATTLKPDDPCRRQSRARAAFLRIRQPHLGPERETFLEKRTAARATIRAAT